MIPATPEVLVTRTLTLLAAHQALLTHEGQRQAQRRQLAEVAELVRGRDPGRAADRLAVLTRLTDCVCRVRRAVADVPGLGGVHAQLGVELDALTYARDAALTASYHKGPATKRDVRLKGWNRPPPGG